MSPVSRARHPADRVARFLSAAKAPATRRAYAVAWRGYVRWCGAVGCDPWCRDAEQIARFAADRASRCRAGTVAIDLAAIADAHAARGLPLGNHRDLARTVLKGARRLERDLPPRQAHPLDPLTLTAMIASLSDDWRGRRDRALITVGFWAALRRAELVALDLADLRPTEGGIDLLVRAGKGAKGGQWEMLRPLPGQPICPIDALDRWRAVRGDRPGALFPRAVSPAPTLPRLSGRAVARVIKRTVDAVGGSGELYSGHSLRAGYATAAAEAGRPLELVIRQTRHRSVQGLLPYLRVVDRRGAGW